MKRWGLYLLWIAAFLLALGIGGFNLLYRLRVQPFLSQELALQDKFQKPYDDDARFLREAAARLGYNSAANQSDASFTLNGKVFWTPQIRGVRVGAKAPLVDEKLKIEIARTRDAWVEYVAKGRPFSTDLSIFSGLANFDHWDLERDSPISDLAAKNLFVPPTRLPLPDVTDLLTLAKLRLIDGGLRGDYLSALRDVRTLAQLMMTTENLQLILAGIVMLDHERRAYEYFTTERGWKTDAWLPVDRSITRRAHRAVLATRGYLRLWTKPQVLQKVFLGNEPPLGFCAAVNEGIPFDFALRRVLEPQLPLELNAKDAYARLDRVLLKAQTRCRLRYLTKMISADAIHVSIPGAWPLTYLPYTRKVFGLRASAADLGAFTGYARN